MVAAQSVNLIPVADIVFRKDLYPRMEGSPVTVQKYAEDLDVLPPIEINQHRELIDGWHRWTAHVTAKAREIRAIITETSSDAQLLEIAIERNATHGLQLSQAEKSDMARRIYHATPAKEREEKKAQLARILSVSERTIRNWLSRIDKDDKEKRDKQIVGMWFACYTQEEIAETVGCDKATVSRTLETCCKPESLPDCNKPAASHAVDFEPPLYNVWKFKSHSDEVKHYGNTEPTIIDNLLYLYTKPMDIVVDSFGGGGSTILVCRKRSRRYWVSDRKPSEAHANQPPEKQIRKWDIADGLPPLARWKDVGLVYLDPPYWKQAEGEYSKDPTDLANMSLDAFTETLSGLISGFGKKMKESRRDTPGYVALIIQPTQWRAPDRRYTDHIADMIRSVKLPIEIRISCPYESQQCTPQMVDWAKAHRQLLVLSREVVVWRVG